MLKKILIPILLLVCGICEAQTVVKVDPATVLGPVKVMNAANNGPIDSNMEAYTALRIPYARTHDTVHGGGYGYQCVDITRVFPDFDADVDSPSSYDFDLTDEVLLNMQKAGTKPFYRLGQSIEHYKKKYGIYPPKDFEKWARICEHIIRHYNEGWADGYQMGIEYWEIWNEPDLDQPDDRWKTDPRCWAGTMEQFDTLYVTAAKHLKSCFPNVKIGGPALAMPTKYGPGFLEYVKKEGAPLDFFSWHDYHCKPGHLSKRAFQVREMLDTTGFAGVESILNEWNYVKSWDEPDHYSARIRPTVKAAAFIAAAMCECQSAPLDMLMYYDLRTYTSYCGAFSIATYDILPPYWALYYWADLAEYGTQVQSTCDTKNIYTCAARSEDGSHIRLLVSRYHNDDSHNTPRDVSVKLPKCWKVTSARITDSAGQDRKLDPAAKYTMASNSIILLEIEKK